MANNENENILFYEMSFTNMSLSRVVLQFPLPVSSHQWVELGLRFDYKF